MVNLPIAYSDKPVTPFGGISLMKRMLDKVGIVEGLSQFSLPSPGSIRVGKPEDLILSFWLSIWTGTSRYVRCEWLRHDTVLKEIFGLKEMPSQSTYNRYFGKFNQKINTEVFPSLQDWFMNRFSIENITIDFDSTVITYHHSPWRSGR